MARRKKKISREEVIEVIAEELKKYTPRTSNFERARTLIRLLTLRSKSPLGRLVESLMLNYMIKHNGATPDIDAVTGMLLYIRPQLREDPLIREKIASYYRNALKNLLTRKTHIDKAVETAKTIKECLKQTKDLDKIRRIELLYIIISIIDEAARDTFREEEWL